MRTLIKNAANVCTLFNAGCGILAIVLAMNHHFGAACLSLIVGSLFDVADGYLAHKMHINSELGKNLDALADCITFGVAPMIVLYSYYDHLAIALSGGLLALCGAWRLARYNASKPSSDHFIGVPIDTSAYLVGFLIVLQLNFALAALATTTLALLFVSRFTVPRLIKR